MANLVNANAANATQVVKGYAYNRSLVKAGILHFGVGNFHRPQNLNSFCQESYL